MDNLIVDNNLSQKEKFLYYEFSIKKWETIIKRCNIIKKDYK